MSELHLVGDNCYCYEFIITIDLYCYAVSVDLCYCWSYCFIDSIFRINISDMKIERRLDESMSSLSASSFILKKQYIVNFIIVIVIIFLFQAM